MIAYLRIFFIMIIGLTSISAYADANSETTWTQRILKPLVRKQCDKELTESRLWHTSTFLMSEERRTIAKNSICECTSKNALNDVSMKEVAQATLNEELKKQLIRKAVLNTLQHCSKEIFK